MFVLPLFFSLGAVAATVEYRVDPPHPQPQNAFRFVLHLPKLSCDSVKEVKAEISTALLKVGESKAEGKGGCDKVYVLTTIQPGRHIVRNIKISTSAGELTIPDVEIPVGDLPPPAKAPEPKEDDREKLADWMQQAKLFLATYLSSEPNAGKFSVESCRIPLPRIVELVMKNIDTYTHNYIFKDGCDVNGQLVLKLGSPVPLDLLVRNVDPIKRVKGTLTVTAVPTLNLEFKVTALIKNGIIYEFGEKELARADFRLDRTLALNVRTLMAQETENKGEIKVTEFAGKPMDYTERFELRGFLKGN